MIGAKSYYRLFFCFLLLLVSNKNLSAQCDFNIIGKDVVCKGNTHIYASSEDEGKFEWQVKGGIILGSSTDKRVKIQWLSYDSTTIKLIRIIDTCHNSVQKNILVGNFKNLNLDGEDTTCGATGYRFSVLGNYYYYLSKYEWKVNGNTVTNENWYDKSSAWINLLDTGKAKISVKVTLSDGCDTTLYKTILLRQKAKPVISGETSVCPNSGPHTYSVAYNNLNRYTWYLQNGIILGPKDSNVINIFWLKPAEILLAVKEEVSQGCFGYNPLNIYIGNFETEIKTEEINFCTPSVIKFTAETNAQIKSTYWDFGNNKPDTGLSIYHTFNEPGNYMVRAYMESQDGCRDTTEISVDIYPSPVALFDIIHFSTDTIIYNIEDSIKLINNSLGAVKSSWSFGDGKVSEAFSPTHVYEKPGTYNIILKVLSDSGCVDSVIKTVKIHGRVFFNIPNTFTPNADKLNDDFMINSQNIESINIKIYNRWGECVFKSDNVDFKWDGNYKGKPAPDGEYIYTLRARDIYSKNIFRNGSVYIMR